MISAFFFSAKVRSFSPAEYEAHLAPVAPETEIANEPKYLRLPGKADEGEEKQIEPL